MTVADEAQRCPPSEVLAAFVDARLPRMQVVALTEHLSGCAECRFVVESVSDFETDERAEVPVAKSENSRRWAWMSIAAMIAIALVLMPFMSPRWRTFEHDAAIRVLTLFSRTRPRDALTQFSRTRQRDAAIGALMEALPKDDRMVATRITGFPYAPHHIMRGEPGNETPAQMMIAEGKAEELIETTAGDDSPESRHARGIAQLLLGHNDDAIKELTSATSASPNDARASSDLAAAYFAARKYDQAYRAADRAVQLDPQLNEARFNRALAMFYWKPAESKKEWIDYLKHDSTGPWADEARGNLKDLQDPEPLKQ